MALRRYPVRVGGGASVTTVMEELDFETKDTSREVDWRLELEGLRRIKLAFS